jgi:hypothetical protein
MTSQEPTMTGQIATGLAQWEHQDRYLWVGHLNGMPIGTIERGRRFTFISADGVVRRGFRTLSAAQQAHAKRETDTPVGRRSSAFWVLVASGVLVAAIVIAGALLAAASSLL